MQSVYECIERTCEKLRQLNVDISNIKGALHQFPSCGQECVGRTSACSRTSGQKLCDDHTPAEGSGLKAGASLTFMLLLCLSAMGVTNQRETTLVWDKETGEPLYNAIGGCIIHHGASVSLLQMCYASMGE